jgi:hypothetical protein
MYKSIANAVAIEASKAQTALEAAKARLLKELSGPTQTQVGFAENMFAAQALLNEWTKFYLTTEKYKGAEDLEARLAARVNNLRDQLVEEYEVQSTNAWINAESRTARKAKVEVYAALRDLI